jgi:SAM-dependent methyltransferase
MPAQPFWAGYQPGFRATDLPVGTPEFFEAVARYRYSSDPAIPELARFADWADRDVLELGCGIGTDGVSFARHGARYTGVDLSDRAVSLARLQFQQAGLPGRILRASVTELPIEAESQDLVYSCGVIHHLEDTQAAVDEMFRVLRPGGRAIVMVYHRDSLNYWLTIMLIRRTLALGLLVPGFSALARRLTGERPEVLEGHRELLRSHGLRYLTNRQLFLSNNTDGPGNPLSKVYSRGEATRMFARFSQAWTEVRFLNARIYPSGPWFAATRLGRRLARRHGWHLWVEAVR